MEQLATSLDEIEALIDQGDLVSASRLIEARGAANSDDAAERIVASRVLGLRGRYAEAATLLDHVLASDPRNPRALVERARLAVRLGQDADAQMWFARAYEGINGFEDWIVDWIDVLLRLQDFDLAREVATTHCERASEHAGVWFRLGLAHQQARHHLQALDAYRHAQKLEPALPMLLNNIGAAHLELREYFEARASLDRALRQDPDNALAWTNLATVLLKSDEIADSLVAAERACALAPNYPTALQTYSYALREHQQWDGALETAERALRLDPSNVSLVWTVAMLQLMRGDYANGWRNHEARWNGSPEMRDINPNLPVSKWNGEPLQGKTIMVWGEQGHGDVLQFVRFLPEIAARIRGEGGKLVYCCFASLMPLLERSFAGVADVVTPHDQRPLPAFDYHLPLCSVPLHLGTTMQDLPVRNSYLKADADKARDWKKRLGSGEKLKVGVAWTGSRTHQRNPNRSVQPAALAKALRDIPGVEYFSVQVDAGNEFQELVDNGLEITDYTQEFRSFDDTAAFVRNLDLVISVCTSVAHLAGGLGVPTWVLLDVNPHWVWMTGRNDSPWYPDVRLFRQREYRQWQPVLDDISSTLRELVNRSIPDQSSLERHS
ncbi:tetratricopeptide repeat protein [Paraburkholderia sp. BR14263]|uniref:tetratricopeptide repeat protein n=1 Tax=unclassified Paraburkholderia TaxID=2615204 RepID=UPI0034CFCA43